MPETYLLFEDVPINEGRKTRIVGVYSKRHGDLLGFLRWYGAWRQYCFFPERTTIWNPECLNTINAKIAELMAERRA